MPIAARIAAPKRFTATPPEQQVERANRDRAIRASNLQGGACERRLRAGAAD